MPSLERLILDDKRKLSECKSDYDAQIRLLSEYRASVADLRDCEDEIQEILSRAASGKCELSLSLVLIAAYAHPSEKYIDSLCAILALKEEDLPNENIVELLERIPSEKSVACLSQVIDTKFAYDEYDEFGVKCLDALFAINTPDAWTVIERCSRLSTQRMREHAEELKSLRGK